MSSLSLSMTLLHLTSRMDVVRKNANRSKIPGGRIFVIRRRITGNRKFRSFDPLPSRRRRRQMVNVDTEADADADVPGDRAYAHLWKHY